MTPHKAQQTRLLSGQMHSRLTLNGRCQVQENIPNMQPTLYGNHTCFSKRVCRNPTPWGAKDPSQSWLPTAHGQTEQEYCPGYLCLIATYITVPVACAARHFQDVKGSNGFTIVNNYISVTLLSTTSRHLGQLSSCIIGSKNTSEKRKLLPCPANRVR